MTHTIEIHDYWQHLGIKSKLENPSHILDFQATMINIWTNDLLQGKIESILIQPDDTFGFKRKHWLKKLTVKVPSKLYTAELLAIYQPVEPPYFPLLFSDLDTLFYPVHTLKEFDKKVEMVITSNRVKQLITKLLKQEKQAA